MQNLMLKIKELISGKKIKAQKPLSKKTIAFLQSNENLQLNVREKIKIEKTTADAKKVFKHFIKKPEDLLKFIENKGTKVIRADKIEKILRLIGEEEGFIYPLTGIKALTLSIALNIVAPGKIKIGTQTPLLFAVRKGSLNVYSLAHQFYHWVSYVKGLAGYEEDTLNNFKNIWSPEFNATTAPLMGIEEIMSLKEAISRDMEAIQFVKDIAREYIGSQNSVNKLKQGQSLNL